MKTAGKALMSGIIFLLIFVFAPCLFAQDKPQDEQNMEVAATAPSEPTVPEVPLTATVETAAPTPEAALAPEAAAPAEAKPSEWVWGEVVSVDSENKQIVLKHLDYDTYEEVQTTLKVGDKTLFENVGALGDIKPGNHLTADFKIVAGSNNADLIVVEKDVMEESTAAETMAEPAAEVAAVPETVAATPLSGTLGTAAPTPEAASAQVANEITPGI